MEPMLASRESPDLSTLAYPIYASPKLDGVRALVKGGKLLSRKLLPIPNKFVAARFSSSACEGLDGELILGDPTRTTCFRDTSAALRRHDGEPDVKLWVFDQWSSKEIFETRLYDLRRAYRHAESYRASNAWDHIELVPHFSMKDELEVRHYENDELGKGYEGLILRAPNGPYKFGRATLKEGWMMKLKRFVDGEATVVGFAEEEKNTNPAKRDKLGRTKRSSHKEGKVGKDTLGAFICESPDFPGHRFEVGGGLTDADSRLFWAHRDVLLGAVIKYKHFPKGGKDKPRHATFLGLRDKWDL
jgi:DNA ligase-1